MMWKEDYDKPKKEIKPKPSDLYWPNYNLLTGEPVLNEEQYNKIFYSETVTGEIVGQGGGGSSPGSEMTEDQYSEYLKNDPGATKIHYHDDMTDDEYSQYLKQDPGATKMHYDPSQMTEGQQAESLYKR